MRKLFVGLLVGCFIALAPLLAASEEPQEDLIFKMIDGYFQVGDFKPDHIIHGPIEKHFLWPNSYFKLWLDWTIEEAEEPYYDCRKDYRIEVEVEIVGKNIKGEEIVRKSFPYPLFKSNDGIFHWDCRFWLKSEYVSNKFAPGDAKIHVRIKNRGDGKIYFSLEIPIEILNPLKY